MPLQRLCIVARCRPVSTLKSNVVRSKGGLQVRQSNRLQVEVVCSLPMQHVLLLFRICVQVSKQLLMRREFGFPLHKACTY